VTNLIIFLLFLLFLCLGVPVGWALLMPCIAAIAIYPEITGMLMCTRIMNTLLSPTLLAIPLFIFAARILNDIKITDAIFGFVNKLVGHVRGGLGHVNVLASVVFAGMSGSAAADAAGLGQVEIKAMKDQGYSSAFSAVITAASATIGPIMPPSIPVIIYGSIAEASIGKLLIGGFFPGLIMAICLMIGISMIAKRKGLSKTKFNGFGGLCKSFVKALPGLTAPFILIGGMLFGWFTPTEAATVAVIYATTIGFIMKSLTIKGLWHAFKQAAFDSTIILFIFFGASFIGLLVLRLHVADIAINFISEFTTSPVVVLFLINILLLITGCFLDTGPSIILLTPILVPLVKSFGISEIHLGIVMILNLMIGGLTPPMGGLMFITSKIAGVSMQLFLKEGWPFIILLLMALTIVTYVPQTVLWLPSLFIK
jgi:tripartite ATP-independent transporter DctM subunit